MTQEYQDFITQIHNKTGIDLSLYKETQMKRRLTSLRNKRGFTDFQTYFKSLNNDSLLMDELLDRMTINVSEFYRNRKRFEVLEEKAIPYLLGGKERLKIWSAACSTGEEPYTLAMILSKFVPTNQINIIATDIDKNAIEKAKRATYSESSLKEVSDQIKKKYFVKKGAFYEVTDEIKRCVTFKTHNLHSDRYESNCDLIVCRNVMIYFTEQAKESIYTKFNSALRPGGIFFVGSTEQIFSPQKYGFEVFDTFFYQKK